MEVSIISSILKYLCLFILLIQIFHPFLLSKCFSSGKNTSDCIEQNTEQQFITYLKNSINFKSKNKLKNAEAEANKAEKIINLNDKNEDTKITNLAFLAATFDTIGLQSKAKYYFDKLESFNEQNSEKNKKWNLNSQLELAAYSIVEFKNYEIAKSITKEGISQYSQKNNVDKFELAKAFAFLAKINFELNELSESITNYKKSLHLIKLVQNEEKNSTKESAQLDTLEIQYNENLAKVLFANSNYKEAENICSETIISARKNNFPDDSAIGCFATLAKIYIKTGQSQRAKNLIKSSISEFSNRNDLKVSLYRTYSELESEQKKDSSAFHYSNQAEYARAMINTNKFAINNLISYYYALKEAELYDRAKIAAEIEKKLHEIEFQNRNNSDRLNEAELNQNKFKSKPLAEVDPKSLQTLKLRSYDASKALLDYKNVVDKHSSRDTKLLVSKLIEDFQSISFEL